MLQRFQFIIFLFMLAIEILLSFSSVIPRWYSRSRSIIDGDNSYQSNGYSVLPASKSTFVIDKPKSLRFDRVFRALTIYKSIHGHLNIPLSYRIPKDGYEKNSSTMTWPEDIHDFALGYAAKGIKYRGELSQHREEFEAIGFCVDKASHNFDIFYSALLLYMKLHNGSSMVRILCLILILVILIHINSLIIPQIKLYEHT